MTAIASHYTANLHEQSADLDALVAQVGDLVDRIAALTGRPKVAIVAHSTAGVAARVLASRRPGVVSGVITLGTPHDGSPLTALADPAVADALRVARTLGELPSLSDLAASLDGVAGPLRLPLPQAALPGVPGVLQETVPGLAIGSQLGGDLVADLAAAAAAGLATRTLPTHVGMGLRARLPFPAPAGGVALDATARFDAARLRLAPTAPEPARPAQTVAVHVVATRPGGWLLGGTEASAAPRVRWAELGVTVVPGAAGSLTAAPTLTLHEAAAGDLVADLKPGDAALRPVLNALFDALGTPAADTPEAVLLALLDAVGVTTVGGGTRRAVTAALDALAAAPVNTLRAARDDLLDALAGALGSQPGPLTVTLGALPLELSLDLGARSLRLRSTQPLTLAAPLGASFDARYDPFSLALTADITVAAGGVALTRAAAGTWSLSAPPWLDAFTVRPAPSVAAVEATLEALLPKLALSATLSAVLGERVGDGAVGALDALLANPGAWLRSPAALGAAGGGLDPAKVLALLQDLADALDLDATDGLTLPGGFTLSAQGADPLRLTLAGSFGDADLGITVTPGLVLEIDRQGHVTPGGTLTLDVVLPGAGWGDLAIAFGGGASGVSLVVTPSLAGPVTLLPHVSGLAQLARAATKLLPHLLQEIVTRLQAQPGPHDLLDAVLDLAEALGIYGSAGAGFEGDPQAAELIAMLQPGWLQAKLATSGTLAGLIDALFGGPPLLNPPLGTVDRDGDLIRWTGPLPGGATLTAEVGWSAAGPQVLVTVAGLDTGPLVIEQATLGWADGLSGAVRARLDPGGELGFLQPVAELGVHNGGFSATVLPLGTAARAELELAIVPTPHATVTTDGALELVGSWVVPLLTRFLLPSVTSLLGDRLWTGGPSAGDVLQGAKLIRDFPAAPKLESAIPPLPEVALGALGALAQGATITIPPDLEIAAAVDNGRLGLRLTGDVTIEAQDFDVGLRFGSADWLDDPNAGVTLWVIAEDAGALPPVKLDPALDAVGLGVVLSGTGGDALISGPVQVGAAGGLLFFSATFLDAGQPKLEVSGLGGAVEIDDAELAISSDDGDSFVQKLLPQELGGPFQVAGSRCATADVELFGGVGDQAGRHRADVPARPRHRRHRPAARAVPGGQARAPRHDGGRGALGQCFARAAGDGGRPRRAEASRSAPAAPSSASRRPTASASRSTPRSSRPAASCWSTRATAATSARSRSSIAEKFDLAAIGIITTKKPDGTPGFSLLLLITVSLPVPIPLGYGFFFAGAGGLLGLNRGIDLDRLRIGLRSGTADSILFPTDIVRRIDTIVRDLEESFPIADGHFLVAPIGQIQWMNPALVTLKVGLIIEIAWPPRFALLGVLQLALPTPDEAVVSIKVAFLGAIDFAEGLLSFDASIYDSYIGYEDFKLSLEGDIAIRISWGAQPDLVASVGGFHPTYKPAAHLHLPPLRRITLSLLKDNPRVTLQVYFAVTVNTVQFGARLELYFRISGFAISGEVGFDVLVQIAPLHIETHVYARLSVHAGGADICSISLDLTLQGPTPWIAHGTAKFKVLLFTVHVTLDATIGQEASTSLPAVPVLSQLIDQLNNSAHWAAELSAGTASLVTLLPPAAGDLVIDAAGLLTVRQRLIPLATDLLLVGAAPPADVRRVTITGMTVGTAAAGPQDDHEDVSDPFAPVAFRTMSDEDRLRAPAYEQRPSGARSKSGTALTSDLALPHPVIYERIVMDTARSQASVKDKTGAPDTFSDLVDGRRRGQLPAVAAARPPGRAGQPARRRRHRGALRRHRAGRPAPGRRRRAGCRARRRRVGRTARCSPAATPRRAWPA